MCADRNQFSLCVTVFDSMHCGWLHSATFTGCLAWNHYSQRQASASARPMACLPVGCSLT